MACHQLIYTSRSAFEFVETDLLNILNKAQSANYQHRISGLLVYHAGKIMQMIEGDEADIKNLFANIRRDSRHTDVTVVLETDSPKRCFATWAMGFAMSDCSNGPLGNQPFYFSLDDIKAVCSALKGEAGETFLGFLDS
ncbi:BLUF domain-containing protein [Methylomonas sp. LL1]|uniref:BLUF domain-containing protein n=1 Tax=Methylomonas sp. LL1 TaxID=2785785 RepID=UPI0018C36902|nr:BLUF domain-containing protein [Methylomonas sp. LL1]QPK61850.1 BLUF domain-containing protein [Methylomonas sp. LL1]